MVLAAALLAGGCGGKTLVVKPEGDGVCLVLRLPDAARVELLSSASGYAPVLAARNRDGLWEVRLPGLEPFDYFYRVDEEPFTPPCPQSRPDGFGGRTCIWEPGL